MALIPEGAGARAFLPGEAVRLPEQVERILGSEHPYPQEACRDLLRLLRHRDAGDLVLVGWAPGREAVSFSRELGSHAGFSPRELEAFVLLPGDVRPPEVAEGAGPLRALDLRKLALVLLERERPGPPPEDVQLRRPGTLRLVSYNVHGCVGTDGTRSVDRVARVLAALEPDVVALQELDAGRFHAGGPEQAQELAALLGMHCHFHPAYEVAGERFGDAVLSRVPMRVLRAGGLPDRGPAGDGEPRGAVWVELELGSQRLQVLSTHLSVQRREAVLQARALAGPDWLGGGDPRVPVLFCGDLNLCPVQALAEGGPRLLRDAQVGRARSRPSPTFPSFFPVFRLDHVLVSRSLRVLSCEVPRDRLARIASDHLPVAVEVALDARSSCRSLESLP